MLESLLVEFYYDLDSFNKGNEVVLESVNNDAPMVEGVEDDEYTHYEVVFEKESVTSTDNYCQEINVISTTHDLSNSYVSYHLPLSQYKHVHNVP